MPLELQWQMLAQRRLSLRLGATASVASDKQLFAPMPLRAMAADLSGLQLRVLACVAAHDRLSLVTGKGQGCRASNERMSQMIGCNYSNLCTALSGLVDLDYLRREKLGRHTVYRVIYTDDDRLLFGNVYGRAMVCPTASEHAPIGCADDPSNAGNPPETAKQYIPLNGGIDADESGEDSPYEDARSTARWASQSEFEINAGGLLARFEREWKLRPQTFAVETLEQWATYCEQVQAAFESGPEYRQAQRLAYEIDDHIDLLRNGRLQPAKTA